MKRCPKCGGNPVDCSLCNGSREVTPEVLEEFLRADTEPEMKAVRPETEEESS